MSASSVTTASISTTPFAASPARQSVWKHGVAAAVVAAGATTAFAAVASAAGVSFADRTGASIPVAGFAQVTLFLALIGVGIAAVLARRARTPRRTFLRTATALVLLSFVPDLVVGFDVASALTLMADHVLAAAIVVPVLARRLDAAR